MSSCMSKTVSMISENINSDAGETHFFNKNLDSSCFIKSPTTYYSNEKSTVDSKTTWPEHVLSNDDHKIDNRYAPENIIPLFECVSSNNEKYLNLQLPNTLQLSHFEKDQMRQHCDEKKVHHMEFTQDGYKLKDYVSELNVSAERKDKWRNICSSSGSQEKNISKDAKQKTTFSRLSERFKSFFKINNKRGQRHLRLGGGKKTVFTEELERLHGPSHNFDGYKDLMVLEQNEIDLVGELNAQVNDNAVFHLAFEMVYNFNKSLPRKFQDKNHIRLIHPSFLTLFLEHGMGEKLPEMTAFKSEEPCSRYLVPILRGNHFALVHVGKLEEIYHMHVFDSLRPTHPNSSPFISKSELNKLANLLAGKDVNTKITRVPEEHASMQTSAESNDCGICTVENVNACLKNKKFPTNTALYENWKVIDQMTTLRRTSGYHQKTLLVVLRQSTTAQSIIDFKNNVVPRIRNQYAPDHIFNVDQTGIVLEETTKRTLAKRGTDKVFRVCQRDNPTRHSMTFNPCISADGKLTGKLFVTLYEPKPPRSFRQMVAPFTDLHVTHSTSGIMTTRLAEEWMEKCLLPSIPDRSVLLLDSWHGFDKMKVLRAVARKNLEIVTFPPRTTGQLQPLDLFFNRQLKCFLRKLQDEIRLKHNDFTISVRNNLLKVARFTQNQFQAPRFAPMIQRGFYELGIVTTRPTFDTPAEFCFDPEVGKEKCKTCTNLSFFKCAHCEETYCIKCTIDHFH